MKKLTVITLGILPLILAACSGTTGVTASSPTLIIAEKLVVGTLKLEGTEEAISREQAAELLPLWQVYQSLAQNGTAAQAEIDALVTEVQETMTASQLKLIDRMALTQADVAAVMAQQNPVEAASPQSAGTGVSRPALQGGPGGEMPAGDPALTGGVAPEQTVSQSSSAQKADSAAIPSALLNALIQLLEESAA